MQSFQSMRGLIARQQKKVAQAWRHRLALDILTTSIPLQERMRQKVAGDTRRGKPKSPRSVAHRAFLLRQDVKEVSSGTTLFSGLHLQFSL